MCRTPLVATGRTRLGLVIVSAAQMQFYTVETRFDVSLLMQFLTILNFIFSSKSFKNKYVL